MLGMSMGGGMKMRLVGFGLAVALSLLAAAQLVHAGDPNDDGCIHESNPDLKIGFCTKVIQSGRYSGADAAWAFDKRGFAYHLKVAYDKAIQDYDEAIRLKPDFADAFNGRCWVRIAMNDLSRALADCDRSLQLSPNDPPTLDSLGWVYLRSGDYAKAQEEFTAAIRGYAGMPTSLFGLSLIERHLGETIQADKDLAAAKALYADVEGRLSEEHIWPQ